MECKECSGIEFGIVYKRAGEEKELSELFCRKCGQVYSWTGSYLNQKYNQRKFAKEATQ